MLESLYAAVVACGRTPRLKPMIGLSSTPGATRPDHANRLVILVPYELLDLGRRAAMEHFAAIGTLGRSGRVRYTEVFNSLLIAHELGHWVQEVSRRPLNRWQAEYKANRMMVAFWRDHPAASPTVRRLANFVAQRPETPDLMPSDARVSTEDYFNANIMNIEGDPFRYGLF